MKTKFYSRLEREYVSKSKDFSFDPDGTGRYRLPKFIINTKTPGSPPRNLYKEMTSDENISKNEEAFIQDLEELSKDTLSEKPIRQFPFLISNRDLWLSCCKKYNLGDPSDLNKMYFRFDLFYPSYNTVVEVDSLYHSVEWQHRIDQARDMYVKKVGNIRIKTLRCNPYLIYSPQFKRYVGKNTDKLNEIHKYLVSCEGCSKGLRTYPTIDFLDFAVSYMKEERYKEEFTLIRAVFDNLLYDIDFKDLCNSLGIKPKRDLKNNTIRLMRDIYGLIVKFV